MEGLRLGPNDGEEPRAKVASPKDNKLSISASGRIKGIPKIDFKPFTEQEEIWQSFGLGVFASILRAISIMAFTTLFRKLKVVSISLPGITLDLSQQIESEAKISKRVEELAERLKISHHDYKSNVLLLLLKIENQLRELSRKSQLDTRTNIRSIMHLSRELSSAGIIDKKIVSLIQDISPAMNRELHESESYLSESEFEALQHAALSVIAAIEKADEDISGNKENA